MDLNYFMKDEIKTEDTYNKKEENGFHIGKQEKDVHFISLVYLNYIAENNEEETIDGHGKN